MPCKLVNSYWFLEALKFSEQPVNIYQSTRRNIQDDLNHHQHRCDKPKSLKYTLLYLQKYTQHCETMYTSDILRHSVLVSDVLLINRMYSRV